MNVDTKTPAEQLEGTNIPEFFQAVHSAVEELVSYGTVVVYRNPANRREFGSAHTEVPCTFGEVKGEKIVTFMRGAAAVTVSRETLLGLMRGAASHALGYYWSPVKAGVVNGEAGLVAPRSKAPKGFKLAVTAKPHPAGCSK
jgi:hypothetical protein